MDLVPVIVGVPVDEMCACGQPGDLVPDPYAEELYGERRLIVLCPACRREVERGL